MATEEELEQSFAMAEENCPGDQEPPAGLSERNKASYLSQPMITCSAALKVVYIYPQFGQPARAATHTCRCLCGTSNASSVNSCNTFTAVTASNNTATPADIGTDGLLSMYAQLDDLRGSLPQ